MGKLCVVFDQCVVGEFFVGEHIATGETANGDNHLGEEWVEWVEWIQREKKGKTMYWTNEEEEWWRQGTHAGGVGREMTRGGWV